MPRKQDYPPILADGLHQKTLGDIQVLCVDAFPRSVSRVRLVDGLSAMVDLLTTDGIRGNLWVDGSFVTQKVEPEDVDVVLEVPQAVFDNATSVQKERLCWFASRQRADVTQKRLDYACDCYLFANAPGDSDTLDYWMRQFGRDRSNNPKGIFVLKINGGAR